ncbi:glutathione S-transferase family protein [Fulvimarina endophytica]|uniref:Glutathione S-transferase family protein n=1 Tax=Fulvimarina endophytica TaxID=2293836 RepID=A0A371XAH1_9HYPH|nr:glutathione S-transferase family protein [Fulvimarina endophytica]RFC66210.1 glutathione S-transferase family protein [Fulvimarina endophytica]
MSITLYELVGSDETRPFSPHCWKVRMALELKGLSYECEPVRFTEIPTVADGSARTLPVLRDGSRLIVDSFKIAEHLEEAYPERPTLFGDGAGRAYARFIEKWVLMELHPLITRIAVREIHDLLDLPDQNYFRRTREMRLGATLEDVTRSRDEARPKFASALQPVRAVLDEQPFLGGAEPRFVDFILFGALQWVRLVSTFPVLAKDDVVDIWFERCLDLYGSLGRSYPACEG